MFASILVIASMAALPVMADAPIQPTAKQTLTPEERKANHDRLVMERQGGYVTVRGTPSGSIVVVNAQKLHRGPAGIGQGPQDVKDGTEAQLLADGSHIFHGSMIFLCKEKAHADFV